MQYDFDTILDRRGRDALALDMIPYDGVEPKEGFSRIPMWVADMSFPTAPPVLEAIRARLDHPNFGYFQLSGAYFDSIIRWQQARHGVSGLERRHIGYENGILGGVSSVVQALTCPGEPILVHSPTYVGFTHTLERLGRPIIHTPLTQDAEGIWRMDYADMDRKLKESDIHVAILCSPHNPCGRVWGAGSWKRPWRCTPPTTAPSFPMRSGPISLCRDTPTSPPSPSPGMPGSAPWPSMPPPRPSAWRG